MIYIHYIYIKSKKIQQELMDLIIIILKHLQLILMKLAVIIIYLQQQLLYQHYKYMLNN